jgi:hypothetical protein
MPMKLAMDVVQLGSLLIQVIFDLLRPSRPEYRLPARSTRG